MLSGVRIIEFEALGPTPFAGAMLAELGAEVIVIHRADGAQSPARDNDSPLDRGKKSIVLDLKVDADRDIARRLCRHAEGVIEGLRPGVMERLGLGPEDLRVDHDALVYGRMTGWGQTGPRAHLAGHDFNYAALTGAMWYASGAGDRPQTPPTVVGDIGGGALYLVIGMLSAIISARDTGKGCVVDAAIVDGAAHMMNLLMSLQSNQHLNEVRGQSLLDGPHWSRCYECADGAYVSVQCLEPKFYAQFLGVLGLTQDPRFSAQYDKHQWPDQSRALAEIFAREPQSHWNAMFDGTNACVAPVYSPWQAQNDPHIQDRGIWQNLNGSLQAAPAPRFSTMAPRAGLPCERDANRDEILKLIGHMV